MTGANIVISPSGAKYESLYTLLLECVSIIFTKLYTYGVLISFHVGKKVIHCPILDGLSTNCINV